MAASLTSPAFANPSDPASPDAGVVQNPSETLLDARAQLAVLEERSAIEVEAYNQAMVDKEAADAKAAELEAVSTAAQEQVAAAKAALGRYAADVYKAGGSSHDQIRDTTSLISSGDAANLPRQMAVAGYVQERKADTVVDLKTAEAIAAKAADEAKSAKAAAADAASAAQEAADATQKTIDEAAVALAVLESDELERERIAAQEAQAAAEVAAWEAAQEAAREAARAAQAEADAQALIAQGATRAAAQEAAAAAPRSASRAPVGASGSAAAALDFAFSQIGKPYIWGSGGPEGYDCSGLTAAAFASAGVTLPRTSGAQASVGTPVSVSDLAPGDLVFFGSPIYHVGIYVGDGLMVHAPKPGDSVKVAKMWTTPVSAVRVG